MDDFDNKIREIKINRNPEYWLNDIFSNLIIVNYNEFILYYLYDTLYFYYNKNENIFCFDFDIHEKLYSKYHLEGEEMRNLIYNKAIEYFKFDKYLNIRLFNKNLLSEKIAYNLNIKKC